MKDKASRFYIHNPKLAGTVFVLLTMTLFFVTFMFIPRVPQWLSYHHFADERRILGIPNFWNVFSNVFFLFIAILGFKELRRQQANKNLRRQELIVFFILFFGILSTGIGSSYYHWAPGNDRLVWDRIPMTLVFMSLVSLTIMERIHFNFGFRLLIPLLLLGVASVLYWYWTELSGHGDLRFYGLVQYYSIFLILFILIFFPKPYPPLKAYLGMFIFYVIAKICEYFDFRIYEWTALVSGHTLKHCFAAISTYFALVMLREKKIVE